MASIFVQLYLPALRVYGGKHDVPSATWGGGVCVVCPRTFKHIQLHILLTAWDICKFMLLGMPVDILLVSATTLKNGPLPIVSGY